MCIRDRNKLIREQLEAQWEQELRAAMLKPRSWYFGRPHEDNEADIRVNVTTSRAARRIGEQYNKVRARSWDEDRERKVIRDALSSAACRTSVLLKDSATRKALETLAEVIGII